MRTKKTVVILIAGKAGSGKSTVGEMLLNKIQDIPSMTVLSYGFADPLKYLAKAFMGWDGNKDEKGRELLQQIGAVGREYDINIWAKHFINQLDKRAGMFPFNFAIITDWRFPNESAYLIDNPLLDIVTIRVFGRGGLSGNTASDVSENSLPEDTNEFLGGAGIRYTAGYDFCIKNDGDLDELEKKVDAVLSKISKQYIVE